MKLALCLEYPIDQHGGTEVLVSELIQGLGDTHEIVLVSPDDPASLARSRVARFVRQHIPWQPADLSPARSRQLGAQLAEARVDLAHFHFGGNYGWGNRAFNLCPIIHASRRGVVCLTTNHGAFSIADGISGAHRPWWFKAALFPPAWLSKQYVLTRVRCEVAVSEHDYHALRRWYPALRGKFRRIYHSRIHPTAEPPVATGDREKIVLCLGTIGPRKGQPYLVDAFCRIAPQFPGWNLVLIGRPGDDSMMRQIQDSIAAHQLQERILFLGPRDNDEVNARLRRAAIFAMPSIHEGLGLSLQEAQFHGCACVASRAGGITDLIQDGDNGLLVPVAQPAALAAALERLISDEPLRARFGLRGPQSVLEKGMIADKMVENYRTLYANILGRV